MCHTFNEDLLIFSHNCVQVSDVPEFNYSESVSGALKGQNHITVARVCGRRQLTSMSSEKTTLELVLSWDEENTRKDEVCACVCACVCVCVCACV